MKNWTIAALLATLPVIFGGTGLIGMAQAEAIVTVNFDPPFVTQDQILIVDAPPPVGVDPAQGTFVPENARLRKVVSLVTLSPGSDVISNSEVRFSSLNAMMDEVVRPYVGLTNLDLRNPPHAPTPPNGIAGIGPADTLAYSNISQGGFPIQVDFFLNGFRAPTTLVEITADLNATPSGGTIFLEGYDLTGNLIISTSRRDDGLGTPLRISTPFPRIAYARFYSTNTTAAFDRLRYVAIPEPSAMVMTGLGCVAIVGVLLRNCRRAQKAV